jgi:formylglycine-generating enzyme required for sulfatase activity
MNLQRVIAPGILAALAVTLFDQPADAQRRRRRTPCPEGQHESAGQCCHEGEEWVEAREACICLAGPGRCGGTVLSTTPSTTPSAPTVPTAPSTGTPSAPAVPSSSPAAPTPPPAEDTTRYTCPEGMVLIRGQSFMMGSAPGVGDPDESPAHRVTLSPYCIDRTEVTVAQYRGCMQAGTCSMHTTVLLPGLSPQDQQLYSQFCNGARTDRDNHPMNCVDWSQADTFCRSRNARLPTEAEWELAARGADQRTYPWGQAAPARLLLNGCDADCLSLFERPGRPRGRALHDSTDGFGSTAPVGTFPAGNSLWGLSDMAGNVMEWVSDWYGPYSNVPATDPTGPASGTSRVARGGHWLSSNPASVRGADRVEAVPTARLATLGFRCAVAATAETPPPPPPPAPEPEPAPSSRRRRRER